MFILGHGGVWLSWCTRRSPAFGKRISSARVIFSSFGHLIFAGLKMAISFRTARGAKVELARQGFASYGDRFKVVNVDDIATDDILEHLKGVTAVIHTAGPLPSRGDAKSILRVSFFYDCYFLLAALNVRLLLIGGY